MKYEATYDKERDVIVLRRPYTPMVWMASLDDIEDWQAKVREIRADYDALPWWKRLFKKRPS